MRFIFRDNLLFWKLIWASYLVALIACSLFPVIAPQRVANGDKYMHLAAYAGLAVLWPRDFARGMAVIFWATILGIVVEGAQGVLPTGRYMDGWDAVANGVGALLGASLRQIFVYGAAQARQNSVGKR